MLDLATRMKRPLLLAPALFLAGCVEVPETIYSACHAIGSSDWRARVESRPSAHKKPIMRRFLVVTGKVTVPTGGYGVSLDLGPVERSDPPVQQILVRTVPPGEVATQAVTTHDVRGDFPALKRYGKVTLRCGDGVLAIVPTVEEPTAG